MRLYPEAHVMHLFVKNLTNVDFSYLHPIRGLVGETWLASIVLKGALDEQGMVCDFGIVKKTLRQWLDDTIDHCLLVPTQSKQLNQKNQDGNIQLEWRYGNDNEFNLRCSSPRQAYAFIDAEEITMESVSKWCIQQLKNLLPDTIDQIQLHFESETIAHSFYHYSHGLKKHDGNCQRIAHGHRSTIEIYRNEQRDFKLEKKWCEKWNDIYIGTKEDIIKNNDCYITFQYSAEQGQFELEIPQQHCYFIETDSTVEFIAQHIVEQLKHASPNDKFEVHAFEGVGKGAIAF
jgi:6-pyruvoyl-tetrahydropterin synthase